MKILIVDQFSGPTPYWVQENPMRFEELCNLVESTPDAACFRKPQIKDVDPVNYHPAWGTTCFCADDAGRAKVWRLNWDSSG